MAVSLLPHTPRQHRPARRFALLALVLAAALAGSGCGLEDASDFLDGGDDPNSGGPVVVELEGGGRSITTADGGLTISVPAGVAVREPIGAEALAPSAWPGELSERATSGTVYALQPAGASFEEPIALTRRLTLADYGWVADHGVPAVLLAVRGEDGTWDFLRDQRARVDGDTVVVSATTTLFGELVAITLPAQARLLSDAATVLVRPGDEVPAPTPADVRVFGPDAMFDAIASQWQAQAAAGTLVGADGSLVSEDDPALDVLLETWQETVEGSRERTPPGYARVRGTSFTSALATSFTSRTFREGLQVGDPAAWDAPDEPPTAPVTCRTPDDATTAVVVQGEHLLRPLLGSLDEQTLPGLEGDVPAFAFVLPFRITCTSADEVAAAADPAISGACLRWNRIAGAPPRARELRLALRIDGLGSGAAGSTVIIGAQPLRGASARSARYDADRDLWLMGAATPDGRAVEFTEASVTTPDGATYGLTQTLLARTAEANPATPRGQAGDLCRRL